MQVRVRDESILADLLKRALAGAAATWAMGLVTGYLYEHEDQGARRREDAAREGKTAYGVAAEKAAGAAGQDLSKEQRERLGSAIHRGLGAGTGALHGVLRSRIPGADLGNGLLFGAAFWALVDEGANVALGLTPGPGEFPWQAHGRGLAGRLVFGLAADTALRALDRIS